MNFKKYFTKSKLDGIFTKNLRAVCGDDYRSGQVEDFAYVGRSPQAKRKKTIIDTLPYEPYTALDGFYYERGKLDDGTISGWFGILEDEWNEALNLTKKYISTHKGLEDVVDEIPDL